MAEIDNPFGIIRSLAASNSDWVGLTRKTMYELVKGIEKHLDNVDKIAVECVKSGCDVPGLQDIYSIRLDVYEAITNLMLKFNEASQAELDILQKMHAKKYGEYKDIFDALKQRKGS